MPLRPHVAGGAGHSSTRRLSRDGGRSVECRGGVDVAEGSRDSGAQLNAKLVDAHARRRLRRMGPNSRSPTEGSSITRAYDVRPFGCLRNQGALGSSHQAEGTMRADYVAAATIAVAAAVSITQPAFAGSTTFESQATNLSVEVDSNGVWDVFARTNP